MLITSIRDSGRTMTGKAPAGGPGVPQRVRVRSITAEQEVGGLGVADLPALVHCGGKGTRERRAGGGFDRKMPSLPHPARPIFLPQNCLRS